MTYHVFDRGTGTWLTHRPVAAGGFTQTTWLLYRKTAFDFEGVDDAVDAIKRVSLTDTKPGRYEIVPKDMGPQSPDTQWPRIAIAIKEGPACPQEMPVAAADPDQSPLSLLLELLHDIDDVGIDSVKEDWPDLADTYVRAKSQLCKDMSWYRCDGCGFEFADCELTVPLEEIPDLTQRLTPGGQVPDGECPRCGAFAYEIKKD